MAACSWEACVTDWDAVLSELGDTWPVGRKGRSR